MNVFIINGGQLFDHSGGKFQQTITHWTKSYFETEKNAEVRITDINNEYDISEEIEKFVWADLIIYHIPVWWFQVPYKLKEYLDLVFTAGHNNGIYQNDGRSRSNDNPNLHYGTGGLLGGRRYLLTTSWNAPKEAFTIASEFFHPYTEDNVFLGFHMMNEFVGLKQVEGFHFHDMEKGATPLRIEKDKESYIQHLQTVVTL